jgi:large subunit ribosomal protein L28e
MSHSAELQWLLVKKSSKFYQLRNGVRFSSDPFANSSTWSFRNAGVVNEKAVALRTKGDKIVLTTKNGEHLNKPRSMYAKKVLDAATPKAVAKAVAAVRPDQADAAFRRTRKLTRTNERVKKVRSARKERSSKIQFKRKAVRAKKH